MVANHYFCADYETSRRKFHSFVPRIKKMWPDTYREVAPGGTEDYTTDLIIAPARDKGELLLITTGQHGVEGYAGDAFLNLFVEEYLERIDPQKTGLILIHPLNPWGMAHYRRVDADNVDLNRNFVPAWQDFADANTDYHPLRFLLEPAKAKGGLADKIAFYGRLVKALALAGSSGIKRALTLGQYGSPSGLYYGGSGYQPVVNWFIGFYKEILAANRHIVHLDIHTGYGPANRMTMVHSVHEPRHIADLKEKFAYDLLVKSEPGEFYAMQGDMIDFIYLLARDYPETDLYSVTLEFGTLGESFGALFGSLQALIEENRLWQHGGINPRVDQKIKKQFIEAFYPSKPLWRQNVCKDARHAIEAILKNEGLIS